MKKCINIILISIVIVLSVFIIINFYTQNSTKVFFIDPNGSDSNSGSKDKPLATFEGVQNAIEKFKNGKQNKLKPVIVYIASSGKPSQGPSGHMNKL